MPSCTQRVDALTSCRQSAKWSTVPLTAGGATVCTRIPPVSPGPRREAVGFDACEGTGATELADLDSLREGVRSARFACPRQGLGPGAALLVADAVLGVSCNPHRPGCRPRRVWAAEERRLPFCCGSQIARRSRRATTFCKNAGGCRMNCLARTCPRRRVKTILRMRIPPPRAPWEEAFTQPCSFLRFLETRDCRRGR